MVYDLNVQLARDAACMPFLRYKCRHHHTKRVKFSDEISIIPEHTRQPARQDSQEDDHSSWNPSFVANSDPTTSSDAHAHEEGLGCTWSLVFPFKAGEEYVCFDAGSMRALPKAWSISPLPTSEGGEGAGTRVHSQRSTRMSPSSGFLRQATPAHCSTAGQHALESRRVALHPAKFGESQMKSSAP